MGQILSENDHGRRFHWSSNGRRTPLPPKYFNLFIEFNELPGWSKITTLWETVSGAQWTITGQTCAESSINDLSTLMQQVCYGRGGWDERNSDIFTTVHTRLVLIHEIGIILFLALFDTSQSLVFKAIYDSSFSQISCQFPQLQVDLQLQCQKLWSPQPGSQLQKRSRTGKFLSGLSL